jgi:RNA polymerase sigma-70 factor (ECF subfamily)
VNGTAGVIVVPGKKPIAVVGFIITSGRIAEIDVIADPAKLRGLA